MKVTQHVQIALLLAVSALLLALLIPGGPVENRDFSHIHPGILGGFNLFLTVLHLGSFVLLYLVWRNRRWAMSMAWFVGLAYFVVYAIDLAQLFPRSPTPMSQALSGIEVLGICVAVPLMYLSWPYTAFARQDSHSIDASDIGEVAGVDPTLSSGLRALLIASVIALGTGIIVFATDSAMKPSDSNTLYAK